MWKVAKMTSKCANATTAPLSMVILLMTCLCFEHVKGSCLSYGHSCWGAHGKRNGLPKRDISEDKPLLFRPQPALEQTIAFPSTLSAADRWTMLRFLPDKNAYYPFGKIAHLPPSLAIPPVIPIDNTESIETELPSAQETDTNITGKPTGSNDSKQTPNSAEFELSLDDEHYLTAASKPSIKTITRHRDYLRRRNPSKVIRTRYGTIDDSKEENPSADRWKVSPNEDIGYMLMLDAAATGATAGSSDVDATDLFNRKVQSLNTRKFIPSNS